MEELQGPLEVGLGPDGGQEGAKPGRGPTGKRKAATGRFVPVQQMTAAKAEIAALKARLGLVEPLAGSGDAGEITAALMRKVMGQVKALDIGPTEATLRAWLLDDVKGYEARMRRLAEEESGIVQDREELAALRAEVSELRKAKAAEGTDEGAARAKQTIRQIQEAYRDRI